MWFQDMYLAAPVDAALKQAAKRLAKAAVRGLPGSKLKEAFPLLAIARVAHFGREDDAFDPVMAAHIADAMVVASWFMLREAEVASARLEDVDDRPPVGADVPDVALATAPASGTVEGEEGAAPRVLVMHTHKARAFARLGRRRQRPAKLEIPLWAALRPSRILQAL